MIIFVISKSKNMKNLILILVLFISVVGLSQNVENKILRIGKDSIDLMLLNDLVEIEINRIRKKNNMDTLLSDETLRKKAYINSFKCSKLNGIEIKHFEKNVGEVVHVSASSSNRIIIQKQAESIVNSWMNSPAHKDIILKKNLKYFGAGVIVGIKIIMEDHISISEPNKLFPTNMYCSWSSVRFSENPLP